jgi:hypothetical protein
LAVRGDFCRRVVRESVYPRSVSRTLRRGAFGVVLAAIAIAVLATRASHRAVPAAAPRSPVRPPSADEIKTAELFRLNANLPSDPTLAAEYQAIGARYFDGGLPAVVIRWEPRLEEVGPLIAEGFRLEGATDGRLILLNPALQGDDQRLRRALCHEIVHVALRDQDAAHGPAFQARLRLLSAQGAFTGVVATEEEKQELRRAVDGGASDLENQAASLLRARAELDGDAVRLQAEIDDLNARTAAADQRQPPSAAERESAEARRRVLQDRSAEYNSRIQRHNDAVAALNRSIEQYNLMVSYPDGLDRERLSQRVTLPQAR